MNRASEIALTLIWLTAVVSSFWAGTMWTEEKHKHRAEQEAKAGLRKAKEPPWPHLTQCHMLPEIQWACKRQRIMSDVRKP